MSELTPEEKRAIVGIFLEAYNEGRQADYSEIDTTDEGIVDAKVRSPSGKPALKLQITRAKELPEQYVKDKILRKFGEVVKVELRKRRIKGIFIHLSVNKLPYQEERMRRTAFSVAVLASRKRVGDKILFSIDPTDAKLLSGFFPEEICRIRIREGPFDEKSVVSVGHGGTLLLSDDERVIEAYNLKAEKYGSAATGVILIIDSERTPVFEFYLPAIKQELEDRDDMFFDEVWVVNNFATDQKAVRVK